MNVREKRLQNDFKALSELVDNSGETLVIISIDGNPPYQYVIEYRCRGIESLRGNEPIFRSSHHVEITLGNSYPRGRPDAKFLTPIFHPDVFPNGVVCLGRWSEMAETLPELVLRIGKVIQYVDDIIYKDGSDNHQAWAWYKNNRHRLPVDNKTFKSPKTPSNLIWNDLSAINSYMENIVFLDLEGS